MDKTYTKKGNTLEIKYTTEATQVYDRSQLESIITNLENSLLEHKNLLKEMDKLGL